MRSYTDIFPKFLVKKVDSRLALGSIKRNYILITQAKKVNSLNQFWITHSMVKVGLVPFITKTGLLGTKFTQFLQPILFILAFKFVPSLGRIPLF